MFKQPTSMNSSKLDRSHLNDQVTALLREQIIGGEIEPGTQLVEQELANVLGISRMPVRDALMELEKEGLIVSKSKRRYVIELTEVDIRHLFQVRLILERLAVDQAARNSSEENCAALQANLQRMADAIERGDRSTYVKSDLEAHELIWRQAENPYLYRMLHSIAGPIFMFITNHPSYQTNWRETLELHTELIGAICAGDGVGAVRSIERQLEGSRALSLKVIANFTNQLD